MGIYIRRAQTARIVQTGDSKQAVRSKIVDWLVICDGGGGGGGSGGGDGGGGGGGGGGLIGLLSDSPTCRYLSHLLGSARHGAAWRRVWWWLVGGVRVRDLPTY